MNTVEYIQNMAQTWKRNPSATIFGSDGSGIAAALWTHEKREVQEVWAEPDPNRHILCIQMTNYFTEMFIDERQTFAERVKVGTSLLVRAGERPRAVFQGPFACLHIYLPDKMIRGAAEALGCNWEGNRPELLLDRCEHDPLLERIGRDLLVEINGGEAFSRLRLDALGLDAAIQLLRKHSTISSSRAVHQTRHRGGLAPWQVRRLTEYLHEHLGADVVLSDLAALVGLSPNHFCTAFRLSLGEPPYRYLTRLRVDQAKRMLATSSCSVTEIALAVGFGSSAHFATVFRKRQGVTPSEWRRERLI